MSELDEFVVVVNLRHSSHLQSLVSVYLFCSQRPYALVGCTSNIVRLSCDFDLHCHSCLLGLYDRCPDLLSWTNLIELGLRNWVVVGLANTADVSSIPLVVSPLP